MMNLKSKLVMAVLFSVLAGQVVAKPGKQEGQRKGPPPEAIEACANLQEGDAVTFETRRGDTLSGTCMMINDQLAAVPEGHKPPERN
ncbi:hypothetical protein [Planctobacterium marinum]|uniref:Uncharacterized protein n=1 Tax=Planctobacterium marinum TaxID=1631968 RepID=A0AA48HEG9_9ALTE|nr:hypothetical protein MACH26_03720 [Planctobacterium marinum]